MVTLKDKRLEIKSHGDELLKEVEVFMKNRPQFTINPSVSKVEKELRDRADFLRRVLSKNKS